VERGIAIEPKVSQGSLISPLLSNIYLHELDKFIERCVDKYSSKGSTISKVNSKIVAYSKKLTKLSLEYRKNRSPGTLKKIRALREERNSLPNRIRTGTRIHYVRYADD